MDIQNVSALLISFIHLKATTKSTNIELEKVGSIGFAETIFFRFTAKSVLFSAKFYQILSSRAKFYKFLPQFTKFTKYYKVLTKFYDKFTKFLNYSFLLQF